MKTRTERGFSLVEVMVALAMGLILLSGTMILLRSSVDISSMVDQRSEMQQNARVAINLMSTDIGQAGTGFPSEGVPLPTGSQARGSKRACDGNICYLGSLTFTDQRLYSITPGDGLGADVNGVATDVVTMAFRDPNDPLEDNTVRSYTPSGSQIRFDDPVNGPPFGIVEGDLLFVRTFNGTAIGVATNVQNDRINFANNDPLDINQPSASHGNIAAVLNPPPPADQVEVYRILVVTFFVQEIDTGDPNDRRFRLMRQINAHPAVAVAEDVIDLQLSYDVFDDLNATATTGLADAGGFPGRIRKTNITVSTRSPNRSVGIDRDFQYVTLRTSISSRNLSFRERY